MAFESRPQVPWTSSQTIRQWHCGSNQWIQRKGKRYGKEGLFVDLWPAFMDQSVSRIQNRQWRDWPWPASPFLQVAQLNELTQTNVQCSRESSQQLSCKRTNLCAMFQRIVSMCWWCPTNNLELFLWWCHINACPENEQKSAFRGGNLVLRIDAPNNWNVSVRDAFILFTSYCSVLLFRYKQLGRDGGDSESGTPESGQSSSQNQHQQFLGDASSAIPTFGSVEFSNPLPNGITVADIRTFEQLYKEHSEVREFNITLSSAVTIIGSSRR